MAYFSVQYSVGSKNEYIYPKSIAGVVWKSTVYHFTDHVMVGETDEKVVGKGKQVKPLTPKEAQALIKKFQESYPPPQPVARINAISKQ